MNDKEYLIAVTEVSEVLKYFNKRDLDKIPKKFISFLETEKLEDYAVDFDFSLPLTELPLRDSSKALLGLIYKNYLCDETEKKRYEELLESNTKKHNELCGIKNDIMDVLASKNDSNVSNKKENLENEEKNYLVEYKKVNCLKRIYMNISNFLKNLFAGGKR